MGWVLRLVKSWTDGPEAWIVDVQDVRPPGGLGEIAKPGLTLAEAKQMRIRPLAAIIITIAILGVTAFLPRHAGAQSSPAPTLQTEIAQVEASVDAHERAAVAQASGVYPGGPEAAVVVGKLLFFDKNLSVNGNTACGFCHNPETGFQGGSELINRTIVDQPGSVRTRFSLRKPPSAAYAAFSPPLQFPTKPGEAKCNDCFIGGNFWDLRATGLRLGNPAASQAEGSPSIQLKWQTESLLVSFGVSRSDRIARSSRMFLGHALSTSTGLRMPTRFAPAPNDNPLTRIGSEFPGPNDTPWIVPLSTADRVRAQETFDLMARAIAAFEASPEVSPFSSKLDPTSTLARPRYQKTHRILRIS